MDEDIKRWTAKRKTALVLDIIQGKTTVSGGLPGLRPPAPRRWRNGSMRASGAWRTRCARSPWKFREQYETPAARTAGSLWRGDAGATRRKKLAVPAGQRGREMILSLQQGLTEEGVSGQPGRSCAGGSEWPGARCTTTATQGRSPRFRARFAEPIKALIEDEPVVRLPHRGVPARVRTRTPSSASSSSRVGRFASGLSDSVLASRRCPRWPRAPRRTLGHRYVPCLVRA
jgi:hypothetical protein